MVDPVSMGGVAVGGAFVWIALALAERGKDRGIDAWQSFTFVIVPFLMLHVWGWVISFAGLPERLIIFGLLFYILLPALMLRYQFELSWKRSLSYGGIVLVALPAANFLVFSGLAALSPYK